MIKRNELIAVEQALGLKTMKQLAAEHGIDQSRVGQICQAVRRRHGIPPGNGHGKILIRSLIRQREIWRHSPQSYDCSTPQQYFESNGDRNKFA